MMFHRGVNLSNWLANATRQPMLDCDFKQIKAAGFDHVRLPIDPTNFGYSLTSQAGLPDAGFLPVDSAIQGITASKLSVILDMHPPGSFVTKLENTPAYEQNYINLWVALAKRYKSYPNTQLAFELLNEPQYYDNEVRYMDFMQRVVTAIRAVDPGRQIIIGAPHGSSIGGLQSIKPLGDGNLLYDFHFYEPYIFTHQGASSGFEGTQIPYFRGVPYISDLVRGSAHAYAPSAPDYDAAQAALKDYVTQNWKPWHIVSRFHDAKAWSNQHGVPIICGEFGVLRTYADPDSRYRWIADVRTTLDNYGIPWDIWDYTDLFGIAALTGPTSTDPVDKSVRLTDLVNGHRTLEVAALKALGL